MVLKEQNPNSRRAEEIGQKVQKMRLLTKIVWVLLILLVLVFLLFVGSVAFYYWTGGH